MQTINSILLRIKAAAESHPQIAQVLIKDVPESTGDLTYPLCMLWPAGVNMSTSPMALTYRFAISVMDRHQDNPTSQIEALSDTATILMDVISQTIYNDKEEVINWIISDTAEPFYDDRPDVVAGHAIIIEAKIPYQRNTCYL